MFHFLRKYRVKWTRRKIFVPDTRCSIGYNMPFLYTLLSLYCRFSKIIISVIIGIKSFSHATSLLWGTTLVHTLYSNIIRKTRLNNQNYLLIFHFQFYLKAVRIEATTRSIIYTIKVINTFEWYVLKYRWVLLVVWRKSSDTEAGSLPSVVESWIFSQVLVLLKENWK